jgi:hypothetical protein
MIVCCEAGELSDAPMATCPPRPKFKIGDKVRVNVDVNVLRAMQEGHGGWNPKMMRVSCSAVYL